MSCATHYVTDPSTSSSTTLGGTDDTRPAGVLGPPPEVVQVQAFYRGISLGCRQLDPLPESAYRVGTGQRVDAPAPDGALPGPEHALVTWAPGGFVLQTTPTMRGSAMLGGRTRPLQELGAAFTLDAGARVRVECGDVTFFVEAGARPPQVPRPRTQLRWAEHRYTLLSGGGLALFLLLALMVPPESSALAGGMFSFERRFLPYRIEAPEPKSEIPPWMAKQPDRRPGDEGKAHVGDPGKAGNPKLTKNTSGRFTQKGGGELRLTKEQAIEAIQHTGMLGVLHDSGGAFKSVFGEDKALGPDADTVMGTLISNGEIGGYGAGGLTVTGSGSGGGGTGRGTIGTSTLGTMGRVGRGNGGDGYGVNLASARLGTKKNVTPNYAIGTVQTRGALDKEIVRRIIRHHINEVKYCYEQELTKKPDLGGRIMAQFTIAGNGQVIASVLQSSTMGNLRVENCIVQAIRRWEFPKPEGGGLVIVSYPFMLTPAGGADE